MSEFRCNTCRSVLAVRETDVGKRIRCPNCGMICDYPRDTFGRNAEKAASTQEAFEQAAHGGKNEADHRYRIDEDTDHWSMKTIDGTVYGPVSREELDEWEQEGRISANCLVQRLGQNHWQSSLVLYPHLGSARPIPRNIASRDGERTVIGNRIPGQRPLRPNNGIAILIVSLIGLAFIPGVVFGLIAWIMGRSERKALERGECSGNHAFLVHLGYYLGVLGTLAGLTIWLGCCMFFR